MYLKRRSFPTISLSPIIGAATQVLGIFHRSPHVSGSASTASPVTDPGGSADLSQAAQVFSKLRNLAKTDNAAFKQLTAKVAGQLQAAAGKASGSERTYINHLAAQFKEASASGSVDPLQAGVGRVLSHPYFESSNQTNGNPFQSILGKI